MPHLVRFPRQIPQPMYPVSQLDQHGPDILGHRQQHAPQGFRLIGLVGHLRRINGQFIQPVDIFHQRRDRVAELRLDVRLRRQLGQTRIAQDGRQQGFQIDMVIP